MLLRAAAAGRRHRARDGGGRGGHRHPGRAPGRHDRERQGGRGARLRLARRDDGARLARHLHRRRWCTGARTTRRPPHFWTNFACIPHRYLYESHGVRRGMWTLSWFLDLLGEEIAERAASLGLSREQYIEREAEAVPAGQRRPDDGARLARADRQAVPQGRDARLRRPAHARPRLPVDPRGDRADDEAQRRRDVRRARHRARRDRRLGRRRRRARCSCSIFADVFGIPASRSVGGGGASLGAAICAAAATGVYPDIETAAARMTQAARVVRARSRPTPPSTGG